MAAAELSSHAEDRRFTQRVSPKGLQALCRLGGKMWRFDVLDISLGGARMVSETGAEVGEDARMIISTGGKGIIRALGRVVHDDRDDGTVGLCFVDLESRYRQRLMELVAALYMQERMKTTH